MYQAITVHRLRLQKLRIQQRICVRNDCASAEHTMQCHCAAIRVSSARSQPPSTCSRAFVKQTQLVGIISLPAMYAHAAGRPLLLRAFTITFAAAFPLRSAAQSIRAHLSPVGYHTYRTCLPSPHNPRCLAVAASTAAAAQASGSRPTAAMGKAKKTRKFAEVKRMLKPQAAQYVFSSSASLTQEFAAPH